MLKASRRVGMTLVELLAVIAIVGLLLALLLPAVQSARETARLRTCSSNIRQVAMAILAHDQSQGRFPMGSINNPPFWGNPRQGWFPYVLPFIESQSVVSGYNFDIPPYAGNASSPTGSPNTPVAVFQCPSDNGPKQLAMPYGYLSLGNYPVFFGGSNLGEANPASLPVNRRAAFGFNFGARGANFRDGMSNTMILGEYLRSTGEMAPGSGTDQRGMLWQADEPGGGHIMTGATPNSTTPDVFYPVWWCVNRPERNQACVNGSTSGHDHTAAARSRHVRGVSIARADGSVTFIGDDVNLAIWRGMATIAGGEIPPGE
jgi:type II secretory pathway pseudopilin PulG